MDEETEGEENPAIKPVADVIDKQNLFSPVLLKLTKWIAEYYLAEWVDVLKAALPPALDVHPETLVSLTSDTIPEDADHPILQILRERKHLPLKEIYKLFGHRGTYSQLKAMQDQGLLEMIAGKRTKTRRNNVFELTTGGAPETKKEIELYEFLRDRGGTATIEDLKRRFKNASPLLRRMISKGQIRGYRLPAGITSTWPETELIQKLNAAQQRAIERISSDRNQFGVFLLHGVTGSGKTEVYLRLAQQAIASGRAVLLLVPEIALLPLIVHRAEKILRCPMSILHSELTERERLEEWERARRGDVKLVVGTRSAVFAPLENPGLIIMDEEHDSSYKQSTYPRYHARATAIMRAKFEKCPIVLGSATPSVESFFNAGNGKYTYLSLPERVQNRPMPEIHLMDMKAEYRRTGDPVFSEFLLDKITERLNKSEQILVLQNRRGYSPMLMCRLCGYVLECPHCSVTMTYHKLANRMRCHYCDYSRLAPSKCEKCGSLLLQFFGVGTEKIAESLKKLYPAARVERFDRDATKQRGSIAKILMRFAAKEIDLLVGTQMLAKGHDFPNVTLVGVIGADSAIGIPDFRSSERLFQLIMQVAGRSGRGSEHGEVVLQTFHPDHYGIRCSMQHNYQAFYEMEIRYRRLMQYPPYVALANILFAAKDPKSGIEEAREFAKLVLAFKTEPMKMLGPAVAPIARISGMHRFQILVKSPSRKDLRDCLKNAIEHFQQEKRKSLVSVDVDPDSIF